MLRWGWGKGREWGNEREAYRNIKGRERERVFVVFSPLFLFFVISDIFILPVSANVKSVDPASFLIAEPCQGNNAGTLESLVLPSPRPN